MSITTSYQERNALRERTLAEATQAFIIYFIGLGDTLQQAQIKVSQLSTEVSVHLYPYTLGNTQPLKTAIQASALEYMDQAAKDKLIGDLTNPL